MWHLKTGIVQIMFDLLSVNVNSMSFLVLVMKKFCMFFRRFPFLSDISLFGGVRTVRSTHLKKICLPQAIFTIPGPPWLEENLGSDSEDGIDDVCRT
jgi:hypothetical protein